MTLSVFLSLKAIVAIHEAVVKRYGGAKEVRDAMLLESAVNRPQSGYYESIEEQAAALFESLLMNHPFVDGNKRTAFAALDVVLNLNRKSIKATDEELYNAILVFIAAPARESFGLIQTKITDWTRG